MSIRPGSYDQRLIDGLSKRGADGDYQVKEMDAVLNRRPSIERLYESVLLYADGKKGDKHQPRTGTLLNITRNMG